MQVIAGKLSLKRERNKQEERLYLCRHCGRITVPRALNGFDSLYLMERGNNYVGAYLEIFRLRDADTVFLSRRGAVYPLCLSISVGAAEGLRAGITGMNLSH